MTDAVNPLSAFSIAALMDNPGLAGLHLLSTQTQNSGDRASGRLPLNSSRLLAAISMSPIDIALLAQSRRYGPIEIDDDPH